MRQSIILITGLSLLSGISVAQSIAVAPQATSCMSSNFRIVQQAKYGIGGTIGLTITNQCGQNVDLQNTTITFLNTKNVNTMFWGNFSSLPYPNSMMKITSQPSGTDYLSTLSLQFATSDSSKTILPDGASITLYYTVNNPSYVENSAKVYLNSAVNTGTIRLVNESARPKNVNESYTLVHIRLNGETISTVTLPWSSQQTISGLAPGVYDISPVNIDANDEDHQYEGNGSPSKLTVVGGDTASAVISYAEKPSMGIVSLQLQALPAVLSGYSESPEITMTQDDNNSAQTENLQWGRIKDVNHLADSKVHYHFSTADIQYNGYTCAPAFEPAAIVVTKAKPLVNLTYTCIKTAPDDVTVRVKGAPSALSSMQVTFTPAGNAAAITETIVLTNGIGETKISMPEGAIYAVSSTDIEGYTATYSANTLTVNEGATETIILTKNADSPTVPEVATETTEPEVVTPAESTEVAIETTEPEVVTPVESTEVAVETTEPEVVTPVEPTEVATETTESEVVTPAESTEVAIETTEPEVVTPVEPTEVATETTEPEVTTPADSTEVAIGTTEPEAATPAESTEVAIETTEPEVVTPAESTEVAIETTEPEVVTPAESTEVATETTEPEVVTPADSTEVAIETTEPEVVTPADSTEVATETTEPEGTTSAESTEVAIETTEPEVVTPVEPTEVATETTEPEVVTPADSTEVAIETTEPEVVTPADSTEVAIETTEPEVVTPVEPTEVATETTEPEVTTPADSTEVATETTETEVVTPAEPAEVATETTEPEVTTPADSTEVAIETTEPEVVTPVEPTEVATETTEPEATTPADSTEVAIETREPEVVTPAESTEVVVETTEPEVTAPAEPTEVATA